MIKKITFTIKGKNEKEVDGMANNIGTMIYKLLTNKKNKEFLKQSQINVSFKIY